MAKIQYGWRLKFSAILHPSLAEWCIWRRNVFYVADKYITGEKVETWKALSDGDKYIKKIKWNVGDDYWKGFWEIGTLRYQTEESGKLGM